jgi:hypothetical protein
MENDVGVVLTKAMCKAESKADPRSKVALCHIVISTTLNHAVSLVK